MSLRIGSFPRDNAGLIAPGVTFLFIGDYLGGFLWLGDFNAASNDPIPDMGGLYPCHNLISAQWVPLAKQGRQS